MNQKSSIPNFLSHLPLSEKGYPVPFFVPFVEGKPDFRLMDSRKWEACAGRNLCSICGKKLRRAKYFVTGPMGLANGVQSDPPMHRHCAMYSVQACPHLAAQKAKRRAVEVTGVVAEDYQITDKPDVLYLVQAVRVKRVRGMSVFKFRPSAHWEIPYRGGRVDIDKLEKDFQKTAKQP